MPTKRRKQTTHERQAANGKMTDTSPRFGTCRTSPTPTPQRRIWTVDASRFGARKLAANPPHSRAGRRIPAGWMTVTTQELINYAIEKKADAELNDIEEGWQVVYYK